jgi:polyisoprenoid-binding protein YceI
VTLQLRRPIHAAVLCLVVTACGVAIGQPPAAAPARAPAPGEVDLQSSRVFVFVGKTGLGHDHAVVGRLQAGQVRLGAAEQAGMLVFDMRSFEADTAEARAGVGLPGQTDPITRKQVNDNMLGADVLDVARHPTATFVIHSALPVPNVPADRRPVYSLAGAFTLHGVTRDVVVPVEVEQRARVLRLRGGFAVRQTDFGMKPYKKLGGVVGVADELQISGEIMVASAPVGAAVPTGPLPLPPTGPRP